MQKGKGMHHTLRVRSNLCPRFPCRGEAGEPFAASCAALTDHFVLLGLPDGTLAFYECGGSCALLSQFEHTGGGIAAAFPSADGTM